MLSSRSFIKVRNTISHTYPPTPTHTHILPDLNYLNSISFWIPTRNNFILCLFCSYSHSVKRFYLSPPIKIFNCPFQGGASFVDHLCYFCLVFVMRLFFCFCCFTSQVNSYGHCGAVSSPNHTFSWAGLNKRLTSNLCTYFRL